MIAAVFAWAAVAVGVWLTLLFLRAKQPPRLAQAAHAGLGAAAVGLLWADQPPAFLVLATALASGATLWLLFKPLGVSRGMVLLSHASIGLVGALMLALSILG